MSLLDWAYASLLVASFFGALLFMGYTFRLKISYPISLVTLHLVSVIITFILFTLAFLQSLFVDHTGSVLKTDFTVAAYIIFLLTLVTGLFFYVRYDLRRKILRLPLVSTHLVMAGLTFIFLTAIMGLSIGLPAYQRHVSLGSASPAWYSFHRHQTLHTLDNSAASAP